MKRTVRIAIIGGGILIVLWVGGSIALCWLQDWSLWTKLLATALVASFFVFAALLIIIGFVQTFNQLAANGLLSEIKEEQPGNSMRVVLPEGAKILEALSAIWELLKHPEPLPPELVVGDIYRATSRELRDKFVTGVLMRIDGKDPWIIYLQPINMDYYNVQACSARGVFRLPSEQITPEMEEKRQKLLQNTAR